MGLPPSRLLPDQGLQPFGSLRQSTSPAKRDGLNQECLRLAGKYPKNFLCLL
jgi:hypothetical protein